VIGKAPTGPGVPESVAPEKIMPLGSAPLSENV